MSVARSATGDGTTPRRSKFANTNRSMAFRDQLDAAMPDLELSALCDLTPDDDFIVIASDGLWVSLVNCNVFPNW